MPKTKRTRLPKVIRNQRLVCEICGMRDSPILEGHHIIPLDQGGMNNFRNIAHLCPNCHTLVHVGRYWKLQKYFTSAGWKLFFDGGAEDRRMPRE